MSLRNPELVLSWLLLALVNGELASTRRRSRWGWMGLSVLLGPLATLILVLLPNPAESDGSR